MQPLVALFAEAVKTQAPVVMGMLGAAFLAGVTAIIMLAKKVAKAGRSIVEAKLAVMQLEAEQERIKAVAETERQRIAALAAVRIVEATGRPAIKVASDVKKDMAIAQAADLLGEQTDEMPDAIEEAHAAELHRSLLPDAVTSPEMPSVKRVLK
jgi:hypothetical protein